MTPAHQHSNFDAILAVFCLNKEDAALTKAEVYVIPSRDKWNDFGYRARAEVGISVASDHVEWFSAYLGIKGEKDTTDFLTARLTRNGAALPCNQLEKPFATLLFETKHYSLIRRLVGSERGAALVKAINDVALGKEDEIPGWPDFFQSEVFNLAMIRASESFLAFRRGAQVLFGASDSADDALRQFTVSLTGSGPHVTFGFRFDPNNRLRGRIAVLIGPNGSGKTASLAAIARGLADTKRRGFKVSDRPEFNQILAFANSGSLRLFRPKRGTRESASVRAFAFDPGAGAAKQPQERLTQQLVAIARAHDDQGPLLKYLKKFLETEFAALRIFIPVKPFTRADHEMKDGSAYRLLANWMRGSEQRQLEAAAEVDHSRGLLYMDENMMRRFPSLGQLAFLQFAFTSLANAGTASVILIDEPENFLHPNLVSSFMRLLDRLLTGTRSIAIVATHSPFVVREVQSAQVHVMSRDSETGAVAIRQPRLQTLGAGVSAISDEVFGDDLPRHLYQDLLQRAELEQLSFEELLTQYSGELSTEALMALHQQLVKTL